MTVRFEADPEAAAHRAEAWCGEPLLHEGEDPSVALAEGTVRRAALDAAIAEMDRGLLEPSYEWKRDYALVLGLDRVLNDPQPKLASGTTLRRHQVDALAGQLAALIGDLERRALEDDEENGNGNGDADDVEVDDEDDDETGEFDPDEDDDEDEEEDEDDEKTKTRTKTTRTRTTTTTSPRSPTIPRSPRSRSRTTTRRRSPPSPTSEPAGATGSSTPPRRARRSPPPGSSRRRARPASSS